MLTTDVRSVYAYAMTGSDLTIIPNDSWRNPPEKSKKLRQVNKLGKMLNGFIRTMLKGDEVADSDISAACALMAEIMDGKGYHIRVYGMEYGSYGVGMRFVDFWDSREKRRSIHTHLRITPSSWSEIEFTSIQQPHEINGNREAVHPLINWPELRDYLTKHSGC
jgi:hypothetical protein